MPGRKLLLHNCGPTTGLPGQSTTNPGRFWFSLPRPKTSHEPRLGRIGCMLPEFIIKSEGSWLGLSVYIERSTQISSMQPATCGKRFVSSIPLWPCGRAGNGEGMILPRFRRPVATEAGGSCPAYRSSAGLGSNVSTCDGPPFMNRKMTRLARAGKCDALGASGSRGTASSLPLVAAAQADPPMSGIPAPESIWASPSAPKPPPILEKIARRETSRSDAIDSRFEAGSRARSSLFCIAGSLRFSRAPGHDPRCIQFSL